jgi:hypothetical protein
MIISLSLLVFQVGARNVAYGVAVLVICQTISLLLTKLNSKFMVFFRTNFNSGFSGRSNET